MSQLPTAADVILHFLYGQGGKKPEDLLANSLIRAELPRTPSDEGVILTASTMAVDAAAYMDRETGPGRFALPSRFQVVQTFFGSGDAYFALLPGENRREFTLAEILERAGLTEQAARLDFNQVLYADGYNDFGERPFIWASVRYLIDSGARFVLRRPNPGEEWLGSEIREIEHLAVAPGESYDTFKFWSGHPYSQLTNVWAEPRVDPSLIGRTVKLDFVNWEGVPAINYGLPQFHDDQISESRWPALPTLNPLLYTNLIDRLWVDGIINTVFEGFGTRIPIYYGTNRDDAVRIALPVSLRLNEAEVFAPYLDPLRSNGIAFVGGEGLDRIEWVSEGLFVRSARIKVGVDELGEGNRVLFEQPGSPRKNIFASFEKFKTGSGTDALILVKSSGAWYDEIKMFDLGRSSDKVDLSQWRPGAGSVGHWLVNLKEMGDQHVLTPEGARLSLRNVEQVVGSSEKDTVVLPSRSNTVVSTDPLILDLGSDGIEVTRVSNSAPFFDIDGDGARERTAWVGPADGFLARDLNGNGRIDGISELFGTGDTSGFAALSELDTLDVEQVVTDEDGSTRTVLVGDGRIDPHDVAFASLLIWQDLDGDGVTDDGELRTLVDLGITSVELSVSDPAEGEEEIEGNEILGVGHFTWADGRVGDAYDVALAYLDGSGASPDNPDNQDDDPDNDTTSDPTAPESNAEFDGEADGGEGEDTVDYSTFEEALTATVNADGTIVGETEYVRHKLTNIEIVLGTGQADTLKATGISDKALTIDMGANEAPSASASAQQHHQDTIDLSGMATTAGFVVDLRNPDAQFIAENDGKVPLISTLKYDPTPLASVLATNPNLQLLALSGTGSLVTAFGAAGPVKLDQYRTDARINVKNAEVVTGASEAADIILGVDHRLYNQGVTDFLDLDLKGGNDIAFVTSATGNVKGGAGSDIIVAVNGVATGPADFLTVDGGADHDALFAFGGQGVVLRGGAGDDMLMNTSLKGQLYGDSVDTAPGTGGKDKFFWAPGAFIMDAEQHDRLYFMGIPLTGGSNLYSGLYMIGDGQVRDWIFPFVTYGAAPAAGGKVQLLVGYGNITPAMSEQELLAKAMVVENYDFAGGGAEFGFSQRANVGDLGMRFMLFNAADPNSSQVQQNLLVALAGFIGEWAGAALRFAKAVRWASLDDPLALDLDGDGMETTQQSAFFDLDGDGFAELTGWAGADDGLLVWDRDGDRRIGSIDELFGGPGRPGFGELATLDTNADGRITSADADFAHLEVWRDLDQDGATDAGELFTLAALGITALDVNAATIGTATPQGNQILARAAYERADGSTGFAYELAFGADRSMTQYTGDRGTADWAAKLPDAKGYGLLTDLATAASNDLALADTLKAAAAAMTTGDMATLMAAARPVLAAWTAADVRHYELAPVLVRADADGVEKLDQGVFVEDAGGGYWTLASGAAVRDAGGSVIARPTLEQVIAQGAGAGEAWRVEQIWSPSDRVAEPVHRDARPYLVTLADGRASVTDYGILVTDAAGSYWTLASGTPVLDADGSVIARPTLADVQAMAPGTSQAWRVEDFGATPEAERPFEKFAVFFTGGRLTDYSVRLEDAAGEFWVRATNLQRALALQEKDGTPGGFNLRNYALDLDNLPDADNSADSFIRARIFTWEEARFAVAAAGIAMGANIFEAGTGADGSLVYDHAIASNLAFLGDLVATYDGVAEGVAVRIALQGGLADYFRGVAYDAGTDKFYATTDRELAPMFEAIFEHAPAGRDAVAGYLDAWRPIVEVLFADLRNYGADALSQDFVFQNIVAAYENVPLDAEILKVAEVLGVDEEVVLLTPQDAAPGSTVNGTDGDDLIYVTGGDHTYKGGLGQDVYVIGKDFGHTTIQDYEAPLSPAAGDGIRFAHVKSTDVHAAKDGIDLVLTVLGTNDVLRIKDQFEGRLPGLFGGDASASTEMVSIVFADGVRWDKVDIAWATSHPLDTDDLVLGTPEIDVLDGGRGDDILRGGRESDIYVFQSGYGHDTIEDGNDNPLVQAYDVVMLGEGIDTSHIRFERIGTSNDVTLHILDENRTETGDSLLIRNQFAGTYALIFGIVWTDRIERIGFADSSFLTESDIMSLTLRDAKTAAEDAIFGFLNADRLDGGAGDDLLSGGSLGDTYVFGRGYGHDVIEDNLDVFLLESYDVLEFTSDVSADDIVIHRDGASQTIELQIAGTEDRLTLRNEFVLTSTILFGDYYFDNIDEFRFTDGSNTVWTMEQVARRLVAEARTEGDDVIYGFDLSDVLDGGGGDDRLEGGAYDDTYVFSRGYGTDTIYDNTHDQFVRPGNDKLVLGDIAFADVVISRFRNDLIFTVASTGDQVTLQDQFKRDTIAFDERANSIEEFRFADQIVSHLDIDADDIDVVGTAGDDVLWGTYWAETLDGRAGNDVLIGSSDGDGYVFDVGYGQDVVRDIQETRKWFADDHVWFGNGITVDNIRFARSGSDLLVTIENRADSLLIEGQFASLLQGVEHFHFADGTHWTIADVKAQLLISGGGEGDDLVQGFNDRSNVLDGRQGDDTLEGGAFADTYLFGLGYDSDVVTEVLNHQSIPGAVDKVVFGTLITPDGLQVSRSGGDLIFTILDAGDQLRITSGLSERLVEEFHFENGTVWTLDDIRLALLASTDGDDVLIGFDDSSDVLGGGLGSDDLQGGLGHDTYRYDVGGGADSIFDTGGNDVLEFGPMLAARSLAFAADGDNLVITVAGSTTDTLVIVDALGDGDAARRIETLRFADGSTLSFDEIRAQLVAQQPTDGNDVVIGFGDRADSIGGGAGNDFLSGLGGGDTYTFARGDGIDIVDDKGGTSGDTLVISDYASAEATVHRAHPQRPDVVISFAATGEEIVVVGGLDSAGLSTIERIVFADGVVWTPADLQSKVFAATMTAGRDIVVGSDAADKIEALGGDDAVDGLSGSDTYTFARGDGQDILRDSGASGTDVDVLKLIGYAPADVRVTRPTPDRADLQLFFAGTEDSILLRDQAGVPAGAGIERVEFGDGTSWSRADLVARITEGGGDGDEVITGTAGDDTLIGRGGDDRLSGGMGADTYVFNAGDGHDVISEGGVGGPVDRIRISGYEPAETRLRADPADNNNLIIRFEGSTDEIRVTGGLSGSGAATIEEIVFDNGTVWSIASVMGRIVQQQKTAGNDRIVGFTGADSIDGGNGSDELLGGSGNDTLIGGAGNDLLTGGVDGDTYVFTRGDGRDVFDDNGNVIGVDRIEIRGYTPAETLISSFTPDNSTLLIRFAGTSDEITVRGGRAFGGADFIEEIRFQDGTVWNASEILQRALAGQASAGSDIIIGSSGGESLDGGAGDDFIYAEKGKDTIRGGLGDDYLQGGNNVIALEDDADTYVFARGDGKDTIVDAAGALSGFSRPDRLIIQGYQPDEAIVVRDLADLSTVTISFIGTSDQIRLVGALDNHINSIEEVWFDNGTMWTAAMLSQRAVDYVTSGGDDTIYGYWWPELYNGGAGNDRIFAHGGLDTLTGGAGDDYLQGGNEDDVYVFNRGDGRDVIDDQGSSASAADRIEIRGYAPEDVAVSSERYDPSTLILRFAGTSDRLVVKATLNGAAGTQIEQIRFDDGTVWSIADVAQRAIANEATAADDVVDGYGRDELLSGAASDDTLLGSLGADTLEGGSGDDRIFGGAGNDVYRFAAGDGRDVIQDAGESPDSNRLEISGYQIADAFFGTDPFAPGSLVIRFTTSADEIRILGMFSNAADAIDAVVIGATTLTWTELSQAAAAGLPSIASQTVAGGSGNDVLSGSAGADLVLGNLGNDTLTGGAGDDSLNGGSGNDVYVYARGDGRDVISDADGIFDTLRLDGIAPQDVSVRISAGNDVVLVVAPSTAGGSDGGTITLSQALWIGSTTAVESIAFGDGTTWSIGDVRARAWASAGTAGDDGIVGQSAPPGSAAGETLVGGPGDDTLAGGSGDDTYVYTRGDGHDVIVEDSIISGFDTVALQGIASSEVSIRREDDDAILQFAPSAPGAADGGSIRIGATLWRGIPYGVERITFDDGTSWSMDNVRQRILAESATPGSDVVFGFNTADTLGGGAGNDRLAGGNANDTYVYSRGDGDDEIVESSTGDSADRLLIHDVDPSEIRFVRSGNDGILVVPPAVPGGGDGGSIRLVDCLDPNGVVGVDTIVFDNGTVWTMAVVRAGILAAQNNADSLSINGFNADDTIIGGAGDDLLTGRFGNDTYIWQRGDGDDVVDENTANFTGDADKLVLSGIAPSDVRVTRDGTDAILVVASSTPGALDGGTLILRATMDPFQQRGIERIVFDDGTFWTSATLQQRVLADGASSGNDYLVGYAGDDTIAGAGGDDYLAGAGGDDVYVYTRGDGNDVIDETTPNAGAADKLVVRGVAREQVSVKLVGTDIVIDIAATSASAGDGGRIVLKNNYSPAGSIGIESVVFDDSSVWTLADLQARIVADAGTPGNDVITGTSSADLISAGRGTDFVRGGAGGDTYVFARGDGRDVIEDNGSAAGSDVIEIRGYTRAETGFRRAEPNSSDLLVTFAGSNDSIMVLNALSGAADDTIELIRFADENASVTIADVSSLLVQGLATDGDDLIVGTTLGEQLTGGKGADVLEGGAGADTYVYRRGDGDDRIADLGSDVDVLLVDGYASTEVTSIERSPPNGLDLILRFSGAGDRLIVRETLGPDLNGVESITFSNSVTWSMAELRARLIAQSMTSGDDQVWGFAGDDLLEGGTGNDVLIGGDGADVYRFTRGDGIDRIEDNGFGDTDRLEILGYNSADAALRRYYKGDDGIVLTFAGTSDEITILNTLSGSAQDTIEEIAFADGVTWTMATVLALLDNKAPVAVLDSYFDAVQGREAIIRASDVLRNDFDADGDALHIFGVANADHGSVRLDAGGNIVYSGPADHLGVASFDYTISDGHGGTATARVYMRVRPPAEAVDDNGLTVAEDTPLVIRSARLLSNDVDGDLMTIGRVFDSVGGVATLSTSGDIIFTPSADFNGAARFTYTANTPDGGRDDAVVFIQVTPVNDAPTANDDVGLTTAEDVAFTVLASALIGNDTDLDGDRLAITGVVGGPDISVELDAFGDVIVTPAPFFWGAAQFFYTISDQSGGTATASATVNVTPVQNAPEPIADAMTVDEDGILFFSTSEILANDVDRDGDPLTVTAVFASGGDRVELFENQTILFTPAADFYGLTSFFYEVSDGQGGTAIGRIDVQVDPVNDAPVARDEAYYSPTVDFLTAIEDTALVIGADDLLRNDFDIDSATFSISTVSFATHGDVALDPDGNVVFTPDPNYWGEASFHYVVSDGQGGVDDATVTLWVVPVHDAPPFAADDHITIYEDVTTVVPVSALLGNDYDIDLDPMEVLDLFPLGPIEGGKAQVSRLPNGDFVIAPTRDFSGGIGMRYIVTDNADGQSEAWAFITVVPVNDAPAAQADTGATSLDAPLVLRIADLLANDTDADFPADEQAAARAAFEIVSVQDASTGAVSIYNDEFIVLDAPSGTTGNVSFTYTVGDHQGGFGTALVAGSVSATHADTMFGSALRDLLIGTPGSETIVGLDGIDDLFGRGGDDVLRGGSGSDRLDGGEGFDAADYSDSNIGVRVDLAARIGQGGYAEGDQLFSIEALHGSAFRDQLYGDHNANLLSGGDRDDLLDGRAGDDSMLGGAGDDTLAGGSGADALDGGEGRDTADYSHAGAGVQVSLADGTGHGSDAEGDMLTSIENLTGSDQADELTGDAGANVLDGGRGDDVLFGGDGDDTLIGGRGADAMAGGAGIDTVDFTLSDGPVVVDLSNQTVGGGEAAGDTYSGIENIVGSFHADTLTGDDGDNRISGGEGADSIEGGAGFDIADYSSSASAVAVDLALGQGSGGEAAGDELSGIEALVGSSYDDVLRGNAGANRLEGGYGNDTLAGGAGSDDYVAGFAIAGDRIEEIGAATDIDRIVLASDVRTSDVSLLREGADLVIELEQNGFVVDRITVAGHFTSAETGIEQIVFVDGTVWDRDAIFTLYRNDRFNAVDDIIRFADEDVSYSIDAARLTLNDTETADDQLVIVSVQNALHGTATLQADGSVAFLSDDNFNGSAFFDYTVTDGRGRLSTARAEVVVRPVNDEPVAAPDGVPPEQPFQGFEDVALRIPFAELLANDFDIDGDTLSVSGFGDIAGEPTTINIGGQEIEVFFSTGFNGIVMFDIAGPNVLFVGSSNYYGPAGFTYQVSDGHGGFDSAAVELHLAAVNDAPVLREDEITVRQGTPFTLSPDVLLADDYDIEGDSLTFVSVQGATHGTVAIGADGLIVFTPEPDYLGAALFTYSVRDDRGALSTAVVNVDVIPLNDPPIVRNDHFEISEDEWLLLSAADLLGNDLDPNGDVLSISRLDPFPEKGSVAFTADGNVLFVPKPDYNGFDASFYYWATDGRGEEVRGTVTIFINPGNDAPFATEDSASYTIAEDAQLTVDGLTLLANDGDPDGDAVEFTGLRSDHGSVALQGTSLVFTPDRDFFGAASVYYRVTDGKGGVSNEVRGFDVVVTPVPDAPLARGDAAGGLEDRQIVIAMADLVLNDSDGDGDAVRITAVGDAVHGTVAFGANDTIIFTPAAEYYGPASFTYTITDDKDGTSTATVSISLEAVNDAPFAATDVFAGGFEDTPFVIYESQLLANDTDPDGDVVAFVEVMPEGEHGRALRMPDGRIILTPDADTFGLIKFTYRISDGIAPAVSGSIEVSFAEVNDAPAPADDFGYTALEDTAISFSIAELLANDVDRDGDTLSLVAVQSAINGTVEIVGANVVFTPAADYFGPAAFSYVVSDGRGGTGVAEVSISFAPDNDPPRAHDDGRFTSDEDTAIIVDPLADLLANDIDPEGEPLSLDWVQPASGVMMSVQPDGRLLFTPAPNLVGPVQVIYQVSDPEGRSDQAVFELFFRPVNDAPVATSDHIAGVEDVPLTVPVLALTSNDVDVDGDAVLLTSVFDAVGGSVVLDGGGNVIFTPLPDYFGAAGFAYAITDGHGGIASDSVHIDLAPVNDAPIVAAPIADQSSPEDAAWSFTVPANSFADADGDALAYSAGLIGGAPLPAWLSFDAATLTFSGTPPSDFHGPLYVKVTASDGALSVDEPFRLDITPVNDAPVVAQAIADQISAEDSAWSFTVPAATFADVDGDALTYAASLLGGTPLPSWLAFDASTRTFSGTPPANFNGLVYVKVTASDGTLSVDAPFKLEITPVNDAPVALADAGFVTNANTPITVLSASLLANDTDADGDALAIASVQDAVGGTVALNAQGNAVFTPTANVTGPASFAYTLSDGHGGTSTATVSLVVNASGPNVINGGSGSDVINGTAGNDLINAGNGNNTVNAGSGDDTLIAGAGNDSLSGGAGDDVFQPGGGFNTLSGGAGIDTLDFGAATTTVNIWLDGNWADGTGTQNALSGIENANGGSGNDNIGGNELANRLLGGAGADNIYAKAGDDWLEGGSGNDNLFGEDGNDRIWGDAGTDYLYGANGNDEMHGGADADTLYGDVGNDTIFGDDGADTIYAGTGDDKVEGGAGNDLIYADTGDDVIEGGGGTDSIYGGAGRDVFVFKPGFGSDVIMDFQGGAGPGDVLDLSAMGLADTQASLQQLLSQAQMVGGDTVFNLGSGQSITLKWIDKNNLNADDIRLG